MVAWEPPDGTIVFPNGRQARIAQPSEDDPAAATLRMVSQQGSRPVVLLAGGADSLGIELEGRLLQLFGGGVLRAVEESDAVIVDGGTESGVMELMGRAAAVRHQRHRLIGVSPRGRVRLPGATQGESDAALLDPNHGSFVLAPSDRWGGEIGTMFRLVEALADENPVALVLAGGGAGAFGEMREAVQRGWPILVIEDTNGLAEHVAAIVSGRDRGEGPSLIEETLESADVRLIPASATAEDLHRQLLRVLGDEEVLQRAWLRFATFDAAANTRQMTFRRSYQRILGLGVGATLAALLQTALISNDILKEGRLATRFMQLVVVVLPISLTALIAANNRFRDGSKWVGFRQAAESVKQEIFRFRTRTGQYAVGQMRQVPPASELTDRIGAISEGLMKSDANEASLPEVRTSGPPDGVLEAGDDGFSRLSARQYLAFRIQNQINYYSSKARQHERELRWTWWAILAVGAAGSVLAALGFGLWVALTTSIAAAIAVYLQIMRIENSLIQYNQAQSSLTALLDWWEGLGPKGRRDRQQFGKLVDRAETVFESERAGWVRQMTDAMADLRAQQRDGDGQATDKDPAETSSH